MVSLMRVLDLSPNGWSALEVTQRRLVPAGARLPTSFPVLCTLVTSCLYGFNSRSSFTISWMCTEQTAVSRRNGDNFSWCGDYA